MTKETATKKSADNYESTLMGARGDGEGVEAGTAEARKFNIPDPVAPAKVGGPVVAPQEELDQASKVTVTKGGAAAKKR